MSYVIVGTISGLLMASVFVGVVPIMMFSFAKNPSSAAQILLSRVSPLVLMMSVIALAYLTWSIFGAAIGLFYWVSITEAPGGGFGSPNLLFTLTILLVGLMVAVPLFILLKRVVVGVAALVATFIGIFGWALPLFAG